MMPQIWMMRFPSPGDGELHLRLLDPRESPAGSMSRRSHSGIACLLHHGLHRPAHLFREPLEEGQGTAGKNVGVEVFPSVAESFAALLQDRRRSSRPHFRGHWVIHRRSGSDEPTPRGDAVRPSFSPSDQAHIGFVGINHGFVREQRPTHAPRLAAARTLLDCSNMSPVGVKN